MAKLKQQLYPEDIEDEVWAKLCRLNYKGEVQEYRREFQGLLFEVLEMSDTDAFFTFIDGLKVLS